MVAVRSDKGEVFIPPHNPLYTQYENRIRLNIPDEAWRPVGYNDTGEDLYCRLSATMDLGQCSLHMNAYEVTLDKNECQVAVNPDCQSDLDLMAQLYEGCYETLTIFGREYVILIHPFSN
jgi:hypothetical protein